MFAGTLTFKPCSDVYKRQVLEFTFHNVSINSELLLEFIGCFYLFTFHNVSINSIRQPEEYDHAFYLHSIMYLLIHGVGTTKWGEPS